MTDSCSSRLPLGHVGIVEVCKGLLGNSLGFCRHGQLFDSRKIPCRQSLTSRRLMSHNDYGHSVTSVRCGPWIERFGLHKAMAIHLQAPNAIGADAFNKTCLGFCGTTNYLFFMVYASDSGTGEKEGITMRVRNRFSKCLTDHVKRQRKPLEYQALSRANQSASQPLYAYDSARVWWYVRTQKPN